MGQPKKWWRGLPLLLATWLALNHAETALIESDVAARAAAAAVSAGIMVTSIAASGRDVRIDGEAFDIDQQTRALDAAGTQDGVRLLSANLDLPPAITPYSWSAVWDGTTVTLNGATPSSAARTAMLSAVHSRLPKARLIDRTSYARGAPAGFDAATGFAIGQLARLVAGRATLADSRLTIAGKGKGHVDGAAVAGAAGLPAGITLDSKAVVASMTSPYLSSASKTAGTVTLSGSYPDAQTHGRMLDDARSRFAPLAVIDSLTQAESAPAGYATAFSLGDEQFSRLAGGEFAPRDSKASLSAAAFDKAADQVANAPSPDLPNDFTAQKNLLITPAAQLDTEDCRAQFADLLSTDQIRFKTAKADLSPRSTGLLNHLAAIAQACPSSSIEVAGHTDNSGFPVVNAALSKRRAQAVVDYLVEAGLDQRRLSSVGYSDQIPVAANDTDDGKARNRRIDFTFK